MRRKRLAAIIATAALVVAAAGLAVWLLMRPTYAETLKSCENALAAQTKAGVKGKPSACKDVKEDDYSEILMANVIDGLSKKDRDMFDYYDNGTIDGSFG
ncbi:hypothetical protein ACOT81_19605 [Streptomyces sp. WI04-05B]|uniref:hypothetical protein n=1 Tax=Streptomyces TaxID=1883 RepID=UPI0029A6D4C9|nr:MULTISPECIES: hypothetical protein [unclassified Streptomyces]MDX2542410.1 hypothetical protein [Streptomyces sp. WI04-05B]MDX2582571.1 hypothetical protein [Streptomyces sp. WI04-05A]MDX3747983.1 hypothetical protein [Streptomyces sp. AK08-02]